MKGSAASSRSARRQLLGADELEEPLALSRQGGDETPYSMVMLPEHQREFEIAMANAEASDMYLPLALSLPAWALPFKMLLCLVCLPFIGLSLCIFAVREKRCGRAIGNNNGDWRLIFVAGVAHQLCLIPVCWIATYSRPYEMATPGTNQPLEGDYFGCLVFYPFVTLYFLFIASVFHKSKTDGKIAASMRRLEAMQRATTSARANSLQLLEELRASITWPSDLLFGFAGGLALIETMVIRVCLGHCPKYPNSQDFDDVSYFTAYSKDMIFEVMTGFWFTVLFAVNILSLYGVLLYYQQLQEIEQFTYVQQGSPGEGKKRTRPLLQDLDDFSKDVAVWTNVYQELISSIKNRPIVRAFFLPTTLMLIFTLMGSVLYLAIDKIYSQKAVEKFTSGCLCCALYSAFLIAFYVVLTVKLQRAIEFHTASIAAAQNDLQRQVSEKRHEMERVQLMLMESNVRVLQALGVYLSVADNRPKLMGMGLESFRWTVILTGLALMNVFFFWLYERNCSTST